MEHRIELCNKTVWSIQICQNVQFDGGPFWQIWIEEGPKFDWTYPCILQFEANAIYRKYKEAARMLYSDKPISQDSLEISPILTHFYVLWLGRVPTVTK
jgi:hypothetical protein